MRSIRTIGPCLAAGLLLLSGCGGGGGASAPALPGAPGNLTATPGDGQVSLAWTAAPGADSYTVVYAEQHALERVHQLTGLAGVASVVTGLLDNVPYVFLVSAVNGAGSANSSGIPATPVAAPSLVSIAIAPASPSIGWPVNQPFTAVGTYSDGSTPTITSSVDWFSDNPGAVVAGGNIATSIAGGSAHITAHLAGITSNPALVTVGAKVTTGNPVGTTTSTTTTSAVTAHLPMDVQSTLEDVTWSATQVAISQQPAHGVATVTGLVVSYVPDGGFFGQDTVVLQETTKSAQVIQVDPGPVVIGYNVNTNTNTNTVTISVE